MRIEIEISEKKYSALRKSERNAAMKVAFGELGERWHRDYADKHFTPAGAAEYGYTKRSKRYNWIKRKQFGHTNPLQFTGITRGRAKNKRVMATRNYARVTMQLNQLNLKNPHSPVDMRKEVTTVSSGEKTKLERYRAMRVQVALNKAVIEKRTRIK